MIVWRPSGNALRCPAVLVRMTLAGAIGVASDARRRLYTLEHVIELIAEWRRTGFDRRGHGLGRIRQEVDGCHVAGRTVVQPARIGRAFEVVRLAHPRSRLSDPRRSGDRCDPALSRPVRQLIDSSVGAAVDTAAAVNDDGVPECAGRVDGVHHFLDAEGLAGPAVVRFGRIHAEARRGRTRRWRPRCGTGSTCRRCPHGCRRAGRANPRGSSGTGSMSTTARRAGAAAPSPMTQS